MASDRPNLSRRQLLSIAGGTLGVVTAGTLRVADRSSKSRPKEQASQAQAGAAPGQTAGTTPTVKDVRIVPPATPEALQMLGGVQVGSTFGEWTVVAVYDFHLGAVPVVLETAGGERYQVDVLRRDDRPQAPRGVDETRHLSLFLSNEGNGATASDEEHGLGLMALAATIRRSEPASAPSGLLTLEERAAQFPHAGYKVPV